MNTFPSTQNLLKKYSTWIFPTEPNEPWEMTCGREVTLYASVNVTRQLLLAENVVKVGSIFQ